MDNSSIYENPTSEMKISSEQYLLESLLAKGELLVLLFKKYQNIDDLKAALQTHDIAIKILSKLRFDTMSDSSKLFWTRRGLSLIETGITTCNSLYNQTTDESYLEKAFYFSEQSKSLLLLSSLNASLVDSYANVPQDIVTQERDLSTQINEY